jgi:hypothetical protein
MGTVMDLRKEGFHMKKIFALLLSMAMILAVLPLTSLAQEKYIIGVAFQNVTSDTEIQKDYYTNELAPALGMEFIFSEAIKDTETLVTFIENCYAKGAVGIINYYTAGRGRGAEAADQYEMFFITQASKLDDATLDLEYNLGNCGASVDGMARAYTAAMESVLADGENHSVLMCTTAAVGQVAASHYYSTQAMLETMQNKYNLTYSKSIDEIINTDSPGEVDTGNPNIKIFLVPGTDNDKTLATISTPLQSGDYDIFVAVSGYANYTSAIAEVERAKNMDIKVVATASIEKQTLTGFTTLDPLGNPILNAVILNPLNVANAFCAAAIYNALNGGAEALKDADGNAAQLFVNPWPCPDAETYANIAKLDTEHDTYVINADDLQRLMVTSNPDANHDSYAEYLMELADIDAIIARKIK